MCSINWDNKFEGRNLYQAAKYIYSTILQCLETYVPLKNMKGSHFPNWISFELKYFIIKKKVAHKNDMIGEDPEVYQAKKNRRRHSSQS